jgi:hypothetical protein
MTPYTQTPPKRGGIIVGEVWVGGKPDATTVTGTVNLKPQSAFCYSYLGRHGMKIQEAMTKGLDIKFKRDDPTYPTTCFADDVLSHLERCGMDSVFYFPSVADPSEFLNICTSHSIFENHHVSMVVQNNIAAGFYDEYELTNLKESAAFLLNSVDIDLKAHVSTLLVPVTNFEQERSSWTKFGATRGEVDA